MKSQNPLVNRIVIVVAAIILTAVVSMATTLAVSRSIKGNATAINQAGVLTTDAYRLLAGGNELRARENRLSDYEAMLTQTGIVQAIPRASDHPLSEQHSAIISTWENALRPQLENRPQGEPVPAPLLQATEAFVDEVNRLVSMLEYRTEARVDLLRLIQIISLAFSILIVVALFLDLKNRVLRPLRKLVSIASAVSEHDFTRKANLKGSDELARLGVAFDQMTSELALTYHDLEKRARIKTEELEKSHAALQLLHAASRDLFSSHDLCSGAIPMLQELEQLLEVGPIRMYLHDRQSAKPVEAINTATPDRPFYCRDHHCNACLVTPEVYDELPSEDSDGRRLLLPIQTSTQLLGTLEVWYLAQRGLSQTARQLLETLSDQLATAIFLEQQITEEQRQNLAEERTVIARELHDSLAQSLSYLKMQVARLRRLNIEGEQKQSHDAIVDELSTGLNSAYRQLREILTTFRLQLDAPDLATAMRKTVDEFSERMGSPITLEYSLPPQTLSPNEEIHTLQIVREGLANAVKHARASHITVEIKFESPRVRARVLDDGRGLPDSGQPVSHYGLIIMQDRARTLGGQVRIQNHVHGGVEVVLVFVPKSRNLITAKTSKA